MSGQNIKYVQSNDFMLPKGAKRKHKYIDKVIVERSFLKEIVVLNGCL